MPDSFLDRVDGFIDRHDLLDPGTSVLVGVSGGADSMACLSTLRRLGYDVSALHVNYGLREGADADEQLVRGWCDERSISLRTEHLDAETRAEEADESRQEAARALRYDALSDAAETMGIDVVVTGHHRDDQAETLLLNLVRGAGPEGLAGMPPSRTLNTSSDVRLVRPLLSVSRSEIETYNAANDVPWRVDPTNTDQAYDRAFLRTEILPRLNDRFQGASDALARAAGLMRAYVDATLTPALDARMECCYEAREAGGWLEREPIEDAPPVWRRRVLLQALQRSFSEAPHSHALASELDQLLDADVGAQMEVKNGTIWRERGGLRFLPVSAQRKRVPPTPVPWGEDVPVAHGTLRVEPVDAAPDDLDPGSRHTEYVDRDRLQDPLALRSWTEGDRLQPLGMEGTKLVSDLLTDLDVPPHLRKGVCVLTTQQRIAWVVGYRLDHRIRVRPSTERIARLTWRPSNHEKPSDNCNST